MPRKQDKPCGFVAGLTLDYGWSEEEKYIAEKMLKNGATISQLAKEFQRQILEVMILVDDLIKKGSIESNKSILREVS
ncbi:MAG: hypothetical protein CVV56_08010 [Tenericutes bacterium HGW-Tenericutes-1]|jgi:predicted transcriptional regulator|nr:MAG: hypothetical protein CVV56_08010 [Tenericutes bacterium HGW-Tenericutes-1]PKM95790.1 MAG: hypothetical protein CVU84_03040 [Firmicutes bacterium HGW-Firmicutes-1]